ncbi:hypothetical protein Tco_0771680 [Tanacetum coccineum]|uniref:Uncharacterized protein n=1 Tax=Tanacetum coccineum TaxID=301880 RepID=A0ABQ4ZFR9_9ASTR
MSRANPQATIVSEEQLVPRANRLVIKKNNQCVTSDLDITDTMLRFVVKILRYHKLYKPVSLTATVPIIYLHQFWTTINHNLNNHTFTFKLDTHTFTLTPGLLRTILWMSPPDPNNTYTKPPLENQIVGFIMTLSYDEDPDIKMTIVSKCIPCKSNYELHNAQDDQPITKLSNTVKAKKKKSAKDKIVDEPEKQRVSPVKSGRGKGFMCYGDQVVNKPNKLKKYDVPRKTRTPTIVEETVVETQRYVVEDPTVQSLLDLQKGSKASKLESLNQKKLAVAGEGSSNAHNKHYADSDTDSDAILYSSYSEESENETDDARDFDMDLSDDNPDKDDDAAGFGVFMYNKSIETPNSTYLSPMITSYSLDFIHLLMDLWIL